MLLWEQHLAKKHTHICNFFSDYLIAQTYIVLKMTKLTDPSLYVPTI